jgi:hypothetical protein
VIPKIARRMTSSMPARRTNYFSSVEFF